MISAKGRHQYAFCLCHTQLFHSHLITLPYFANTAYSCRTIRCGSGRSVLEDKADIAALPVATVSQGQIYELLFGGGGLRFETRTCRNKAVALLASSEGRSAVQLQATGNSRRLCSTSGMYRAQHNRTDAMPCLCRKG